MNTQPIPLVLSVLALSSTLSSAATVWLGAAESFAVLGGSAVTSTGPTAVTGDLGVSPGGSITGFGPGTVTGGALHANDATAVQAHADASAAFDELAGLPVNQDLTGEDLGGRILAPGVYHFSSSAQLTGTLTLDGQGQAEPLFVFQIGSTLTTASNASILLINGADAGDPFFQVGSSATLGTGTAFAGTIIARAGGTLTTGASVDGRIIALDEAVTLDSNRVSAPAVIPEPGGCALLLSGLMSLAARRRRAAARPPGPGAV